jgi:hypothetical protein
MIKLVDHKSINDKKKKKIKKKKKRKEKGHLYCCDNNKLGIPTKQKIKNNTRQENLSGSA